MITVTYESGEVLPPLLSSLATFEPSAQVIIVDNASPGGTPNVEGVALLPMESNRGYGAACNVGGDYLATDPPDVVAFLNPDTRLTGPSLSQLASQMLAQDAIGIAVGPVVDGDGKRAAAVWGEPSVARSLWHASGFRAPRLRRLVGSVFARGVFASGASMARDSMKVDGYVVGGAMLVRWACWADLGGFDEEFFLGWEDTDFCRRAREAGWEVWMLPCDPIVHLGRSSSRGVGENDWWGWYLDGAEIYGRKHLSRSRSLVLRSALRLGRRGRIIHSLLREGIQRRW